MSRTTLLAAAAVVAAVAPGTGCRHCRSDRCDPCAAKAPIGSGPALVVGPSSSVGGSTLASLPSGYVPGSAVVVSDTGNPTFSGVTYPVGEPTPLRATPTASAGAPANELPLPKIPAPGVPESPVGKGGNPPLAPLAPARTTGGR